MIADTTGVASSTPDPTPSNNAATRNTAVDATPVVAARPVADLAVELTGGPAFAGAHFTYTVTVSNRGPGPVADAVLSFTMPAGVMFVSATGQAAPINGVLTIHLGALAGAVAATATIEVCTMQLGTLTAKARVTGDIPDPDLTNNAAERTIVASKAPPKIIALQIMAERQEFTAFAQAKRAKVASSLQSLRWTAPPTGRWWRLRPANV